MINLKDAQSILDNYLYHEVNVDSLHSIKTITNKVYYEENEYCWMLENCRIDEEYSEGFEGKIGGGPFFIDKQNGNIYLTGSGVLCNWEEDFIKLKRGLEPEMSWIPLKNFYLNCNPINSKRLNFDYLEIESTVNDKESDIRKYLLSNSFYKNENHLKFVNNAFTSIKGKLTLGFKVSELNEDIIYLTYKFEDGLLGEKGAIGALKKWCRIFEKKSSDNYWIKIIEKDFSKDFKNWELEMWMEIK